MNKISINKAVIVGHLLTTLPIILISIIFMLLVKGFLAEHLNFIVFFSICLFALSWLWWSYIIPHWRVWACNVVGDVPRMLKLSEQTCLIWKKDNIFSKTEFKIK